MNRGCAVITLLPELNDAQWSEIEQVGSDVLQRLQEFRPPALLVDLTALDYMGSAMVALLVRFWKTVRRDEGAMVVVTQNEMVQEVLELAGLNTVWSIVETREEGLQELKPVVRSSETGGFALLTFLGVIAILAAGLGTYFLLRPGDIVEPRAAGLMGLGCSVVGLIVGAVLMLRESGGRRAAGVAVALASLALLGTGLFQAPEAGGQVEELLDKPLPGVDADGGSSGKDEPPQEDNPEGEASQEDGEPSQEQDNREQETDDETDDETDARKPDEPAEAESEEGGNGPD